MSYIDENNGINDTHALPDFIEEMLQKWSKKKPLDKALKRLKRFGLIERTVSHTYILTRKGKEELHEYIIYQEQQHQKGPHYFIESEIFPEDNKGKIWKTSPFFSLLGFLGLSKTA